MQVNPPKKGAHLKEDINISKEKYVLDEWTSHSRTHKNELEWDYFNTEVNGAFN